MPADQDLAAATPNAPRGRPLLLRFAPLALLLALAALVLVSDWHSLLSLETLVRHQMAIDAFLAEHRLAALVIYMLVYIVVVALSVPGAVWLTLAGGVLFGALVGTIATVIGATIGATIIFKVAQSAIGEGLLRRAGPRAAKVAEGIRADAFHYLLFLRLVPAFPFFLVNLAAALVAMPLSTFVAATLIGIIPATFAFSLAGAGLDSVIAAQAASYQACLAAGRTDCRVTFDPAHVLTPQLLAALVALGVIALVPVVVRRWRARRQAPVRPQSRS
jgi:uncharacterized membrane protein YdjX (TVP38/TMEM64 family)